MPRPIFISAGIGAWYDKGVKRLAASLDAVNAPVERNLWIDEWPDNKFPREPVYCIKAAALDHAMKAGFTTLIWADASITSLRPIEPWLEEVRAKGYWLGQSGHNAAQTCSDACLAYFGIDRDAAERIHDCATGLFAMDITRDKPRQFIERFIKAARDGAFAGSRRHAKQSSDPRFKFHRQDQSAATIIASQLGMPLDAWQSHVCFKWDNCSDKTFKCEGM